MIRILHFTIPTHGADPQAAVDAMQRHIPKIQAGHRTLLDATFTAADNTVDVVLRCHGDRHWHTIGNGREIMAALMRRSTLRNSTATLTQIESPPAPHTLTKETGRHWTTG